MTPDISIYTGSRYVTARDIDVYDEFSSSPIGKSLTYSYSYILLTKFQHFRISIFYFYFYFSLFYFSHPIFLSKLVHFNNSSSLSDPITERSIVRYNNLSRNENVFHPVIPVSQILCFSHGVDAGRSSEGSRGATRDTPPLKSYARDILKLNGRRCRIMVQNGKLYLTSH